jgi:transcriptional regulator with XRE-family HTH domain
MEPCEPKWVQLSPISQYGYSVKETKSAMNRALAAEIRAERGAKQITVRDLADQAQMAVSTLNRVLAGERDINITQMALLAHALDTTPESLVRKAVERAGGVEVLVEEVAASRQSSGEVSDVAGNVTPIRKRPEDLTTDEIEAAARKAATRDAEMDTDEHFD